MMSRVIRLVVAVASTLALWACDPCTERSPPRDRVYLVRSPDQATQQLIAQCLDPTQNDCLPLCEKVSGLDAASIIHCAIDPQTDPTYVQVRVGVDIMSPCGD